MDKQQLFESLRKRSSRTGIVTADRYFRDVEGCFDGGFCPTVAKGYTEEQWKSAIKSAESKLTYNNPETEVLKSTIKDSGCDEGIMRFDAIITTPFRDRDKDSLVTLGGEIDPNSALLMYHVPMETVGAFKGLKEHSEFQMKGRFVVADTAMGNDSSKLIKVGALRISHGFEPIKWKEMEDGEGYLFEKFRIYEVSLVSIPSNIQAVITEFSGKDFETPFVRSIQNHYWKAQNKESVSLSGSKDAAIWTPIGDPHVKVLDVDGTDQEFVSKEFHDNLVATLSALSDDREPSPEVATKQTGEKECSCKSAKNEQIKEVDLKAEISRLTEDQRKEINEWMKGEFKELEVSLEIEETPESFDETERKYFAALAESDTDAIRRQYRRLKLMLSASEEQEQAREMDEVLSMFT